MTPIFSFLRTLAETVRQLVASGKAVHVTEATARELELLAGLPWEEAPRFERVYQVAGGQMIPDMLFRVTPADLALGWLLASRARFDDDVHSDGIWRAQEGEVKRAAECAEVAVIASRMMPEVRVMAPEQDAATRESVARLMRELGTGSMIKPLEVEPVGIDPHSGTREGARAAWEFVARWGIAENEIVLASDRRGGKMRQHQIQEKHRRELEAMK